MGFARLSRPECPAGGASSVRRFSYFAHDGWPGPAVRSCQSWCRRSRSRSVPRGRSVEGPRVDVATAPGAVARVETGEAAEAFGAGGEFLGDDLCRRRDGGWRPGLEHRARGDELRVDVARGEQPVVAQRDEAVGQDVQQEAAEGFVRVQRRDFFAAGTEGDGQLWGFSCAQYARRTSNNRLDSITYRSLFPLPNRT